MQIFWFLSVLTLAVPSITFGALTAPAFCPAIMLDQAVWGLFPTGEATTPEGRTTSLEQFSAALLQPPNGKIWLPPLLLQGVHFLGDYSVLKGATVTGFDQKGHTYGVSRFYRGKITSVHEEQAEIAGPDQASTSVDLEFELPRSNGEPQALFYVLADKQDIAPVLATYLKEKAIFRGLREYFEKDTKKKRVLCGADLDFAKAVIFLSYRLPPTYKAPAMVAILRGKFDSYTGLDVFALLENHPVLKGRYTRNEELDVVNSILNSTEVLGPFPKTEVPKGKKKASVSDDDGEAAPDWAIPGPRPAYAYEDWAQAIELLRTDLGFEATPAAQSTKLASPKQRIEALVRSLPRELVVANSLKLQSQIFKQQVAGLSVRTETESFYPPQAYELADSPRAKRGEDSKAYVLGFPFERGTPIFIRRLTGKKSRIVELVLKGRVKTTGEVEESHLYFRVTDPSPNSSLVLSDDIPADYLFAAAEFGEAETAPLLTALKAKF